MVLLPAVISLEAMGLLFITEKAKRIRPLIPGMLVCLGILAFAYAFATAPVMPEDTGLERCIQLAEPYHTENTMSTSSPFLAFAHKIPAIQAPEYPSDFSCSVIEDYETDYVVYFADWWYEQIRDEFINATSGCLEVVIEEGECTIYRVT
jgi:hypothetical protein